MSETIYTWLNTQHLWVQEAACRLLTKGTIDDSDVADFVAIIKTTVENPTGSQRSPRNFPAFGAGGGGSATLRLKSIGEIVGIDRLAPKQPLEFPRGNLAVIYGNNGSGKSGYARILKKACGKAGAPDLKSNVFVEEPPVRKCTISFESDGVATSREWIANSDPIPELQSVDIFDSASGRIYLDSETEVSFSPPELVLFYDLVEIFKRVDAVFVAEQTALPKALPKLPPAFETTTAGKIYVELKAETKAAELAVLYPWTEEDKKTLADLIAQKSVTNPAEEAKRLRASKAQLDSLSAKLSTARAAITSIKCGEIFDLSAAAVSARKIATEGTAALTQSALLNGVGSETWKALWNAARAYSIAEVYSELHFPNVEEGAKCVLCQQDLNEASKQRLADFEAYVTGTLETRAKEAEAAAKNRVDALPDCPQMEQLVTSSQAAGLLEADTKQLISAWEEIQSIVASLRVVPLVERPEGLDIAACPLVEQLNKLSQSAESYALKYEDDAKIIDKNKIEAEIQELEARKWTADQKAAIDAEIGRLNSIAQILEWNKHTSTTRLSIKAGELSESLITDAYVTRFNSELKNLGASRIQVELIKSRVQQGQVKHKIQLRGIGKYKTGDILSEGEHRIVTLAAFLATVMAKPDKAPFVFDDPISSLDQDYEEKTIDRLIELSRDRQVIILTHRLSLLGILDDKADPQIVTIKHEYWGAGQPGETPIFGKKPDGALRNIKNSKLVQARATLENDGRDAYYPLAKAICSDIRILVERIVEFVFLADVIQRHRRAVNTYGKVHNLAKITATDCALVDKFMSRYSRFEHSQPDEAPVELPTPEELSADLDELIAWHDEFKVRPGP
jgi:energy-coupling factor transporter ATP-binding protein EcfA2